MKKVLAIVGPTAVGKTALSIRLAKKFNGEIISGDSMQVYRGLDIGTAKVTKAEAEGIPHHLIDICDIKDSYSAAEFQKMGRAAIDAITARGKLPIVVGGTGLYIQALLYDFSLGGRQENQERGLREKYEAYGAAHGNQGLWELLAKRDPAAAAKIHFNNQRKVVRALEVLEQTGRSITAPEVTPAKLYDYFLVGLNTDRELLYRRIDERVELMLAAGLADEARLLQQAEETQAAKGIGYREFFPYFKGESDLAAVKEQIQQDSRRYAKRQLTWFRNRMTPRWLDLVQDPESAAELEKEINDWLGV